MNEQEIAALVAQSVAQAMAEANTSAEPNGGFDIWQAIQHLGIMKAIEAFMGGLFYLTVLWVCSGDHKLGRFLFRYSDEIALNEELARHNDVNIALRARDTLGRVNSARVIGFAIVVGCILAF